ncbi:MAG TPA: ABC transporter permease [Terriglobales bacterium]|nr:ABC transporter permease [Terriglobales bacterium]
MTLFQDARYGMRTLLKSPGTTVVMLLILGVGIGANTAIFSFVNALYLKPPAVDDPDAVVKVFARGPHGHFGAGFSYPEYESLRDHNSSLGALAAETRLAQLHVRFASEAREMPGAFVSANYFSTLGIRPLRGRFFLPEEDAVADRNPVAVISAELWKSQFHNDAAVIGRSINVNQVELQIVGITPADFQGVHAGNPQQLWIPLMMLHAARYFGTCPHAFDCTVIDDLIGRLAPGYRRRDAQDELDRIVVWSASDWPASAGRRELVTFSVTGVDPDERADFTAQMSLLMCVAIVLLLVSCANLAGLFLARSLSRAREIAVRLSIGASRSRVVRQLVTESMLISSLSCALGLAFSLWAKNRLASFYNVDSEGFRHLYDLRLDWRVLAFSFAVTVITGILFGLLPAMRATRQDLVTQLKENAGAAGSQTRGWFRQGLVAAQVALSLTLLVSAGLLVRSSQAIRQGTNFDPRHIAVVRVRPELLSYSPRQNEEFFHRAVERIKEIPGVEKVTFVRGGEGLIWEWSSGREVTVDLSGGSAQAMRVRHHDIGLEFFTTLNIPLLEGRDFGEHDGANAPAVAILNQTLALRLWPQTSALGRRVMVNNQPVRVVGVAADIQPPNSLLSPAPYLFLPFWQSDPGKEGDMRLAIRVKGDPGAILPALRHAIQKIDPNIPIGEDMSMSEQIAAQYMPVILSSSVISYCGMIALCLSAVGMFSVLTFYVRTRTREIGIRMALGAQISSVLRLVVGQGFAMSVSGVAAGLILALATTRLLAAWLYGVRALDFATFALAAILLFAVAIAASYLPARRAAEVDPMIALREE